MLLLEDLHWADEATLDLINAADAVLRDSPVLVVATTRPTLLERHPHWGEGLDFHTVLPLRSLSRRETRRLLDEILKRADHVPAGAQRSRRDGVGGQPVLRRGAGQLVPRGRRDHQGRRTCGTCSTSASSEAKVPATLRSVLQARLDALPTTERLTLQRASVIGRVFWDDAVESLRLDGDQALARTGRADHGGARPPARPRGRVPAGEVGVRPQPRVPVQARPAARRRLRGHAAPPPADYHRLAARWFEQMAESSHRTDEYAGLIADHHANGGDREAAARWYLVAGQQAASVHALADARRLLGQGIELVPESAVAAPLRPPARPRVGARPDRRPAPRSKPIWPSSTPSKRPSPRTTPNGASGCC